MLDVRRLRLLVELSDRGTLSAVAEALSYSPSSVSQQLSQLEREAGVPLLVQVGRRVQLTPQAEVLVGHARAVLDRLEEAESEVARSLTAVGGTVRIAVFQSAAHAVVPQALTLLRAEHPALRVEVTEREPDVGLFEVSARDFDLVIAEQYPGHTRAHREELDRVHLVADAIRLALPPHPAHSSGYTIRRADESGTPGGVADRISAGAHSMRGGTDASREQSRVAASDRSLLAAATMPWVLEPEGTASRDWAEQLCREAGFEPDVRFETADLMAHIRLIRSGNAVGLLPDLVWAGEAPSVTLVDLPGHPEREVFTSTRHAAAARPAVVACRDALARAARATATPSVR
ncbi:DNA-binding transcriptional LysR family regulator [Agromyces hippuratus]|uniref:DNA-binding transcriptional LysR family regulator n=1 Tax=Agromyces hippuratus TaxID=286438 RepID=A0A852X0B1_9MICO|nr:LysR family transcriptional regulator [Agromyces hippuratus]NYG21940.1 DNA-binding transcriptional LysR family regulator [Agromyces hippuratus]